MGENSAAHGESPAAEAMNQMKIRSDLGPAGVAMVERLLKTSTLVIRGVVSCVDCPHDARDHKKIGISRKVRCISGCACSKLQPGLNVQVFEKLGL